MLSEKRSLRRAASSTARLGVLLILAFAVPLSIGAQEPNWLYLGPDGGDVATLAVDPSRPGVIWAGMEDSLLFKSTDAGATWAAVPLIYTDPKSLAVDPTDPTTLYAYTGWGFFQSLDDGTSWSEANSPGFSSVNLVVADPAVADRLFALVAEPFDTSSAAYRSDDAGTTWTELRVFLNRTTSALVVDPTDSQIVYVTTLQGEVYESADAGDSWTMMAGVPAGIGAIRTLAVDPDDGDVLYLGASTGAYKSSDGGTSWAPASSGLGGAAIQALLVDPAESQRIYAGTEDAGIFRSLDGGMSWSPPTTPPDALSVTAIAAEATPPGCLWAGTAVTHAGTFGGVFKSCDQGATWTFSSQGLSGHQRLSSLAVDADGTPAPTLFVGHDRGGLYRSADLGETWTAASDFPVFSLALDSLGNLWAGANSGRVFRTADAGENWLEMPTAARLGASLLAVAPSDPTVAFAFFHSSELLRTTDGGASWEPAASGWDSTAALRSLAIAPNDPAHLYAGTRSGLGAFESEDSGENWWEINVGIDPPYWRTVWGLAVDPGAPQRLYAMASDERAGFPDPELCHLYRSQDGGASWQSLHTAETRCLGALALDPENPSVVAQALPTGEVLWSGGRGMALRSLGQVGIGPLSLEEIRQRSLVRDVAFSPDRLFVGTSRGIFLFEGMETLSDIFSDGFESGDVSAWTPPGSSP